MKIELVEALHLMAKHNSGVEISLFSPDLKDANLIISKDILQRFWTMLSSEDRDSFSYLGKEDGAYILNYKNKSSIKAAPYHEIKNEVDLERGEYYFSASKNGEIIWEKYLRYSDEPSSVKKEMKDKKIDFSLALLFVKDGRRILREGWNGRGMFVIYQKGYPDGISCNKQTANAWGLKEGDLFKCNPYLQIKNVDGSHSMWVPSIGDILAEDWVVMNSIDEREENNNETNFDDSRRNG